MILNFGTLLAQETRNEIWPELNSYFKLNEQFRVRFAAGINRSKESTDATDGFLEADLDIGIKTILRRKPLFRQDSQKGKFLTFRAGYAYVPNFGDDPSVEHRGIVEFTGRYPLPATVLLSDRNRMDFRSIDGDKSRRYRNRIKFEREFAVGKFHFNQYVTTEFFYNSRVDSWSRNEYSIGTEFPFRHHFVMEFYYMRQDNKGSGATDVNALGWVFQMHFGN